MLSLLTFDIARWTGRAFFESPAASPQCDTWRGKAPWESEAYGDYYVELEDYMVGEINRFRPLVVGFESPIIAVWGGSMATTEHTLRRLIGGTAILERLCKRRHLPCHEVHNQTAKSFIGVPGRRPKEMKADDYKELMVDAIRALGHTVKTSHEADAVAIGLVILTDLGLLSEC